MDLLRDVTDADAFVAEHNVASIRVLEKCGFTRCEEETPAEPSPDGVLEILFRLDGAAG